MSSWAANLTDYARAYANTLRDALIKRGLLASSIERNFEGVRSVFDVAAKEAGLDVLNPFSPLRHPAGKENLSL